MIGFPSFISRVSAPLLIAGSLAVSSGRNILQSLRINSQSLSGRIPPSSVLSTIDSRSSSYSQLLAIPKSSPSQVLVQHLQGCSRKELLQLYFSDSVCRIPTSSELQDDGGEWDGLLLDNNGLIMTAVSNFLTHRLFGRGKRWNGKSFQQEQGQNHFKNESEGKVQLRHKFDYKISPSLFPGRQRDFAAVLDYSKYQHKLSIWRSMKDEIRCITVSNGKVLLGWGSMGWSGGMLNSAPFCLWKATRDKQSSRR